MSRPTQIVLLDDQPAVRAGIRAVVSSEPDLQLVGAATGEAQLWTLLGPARPDVVVLDLLHHGQIGLNLCLEIRRQPDPPAVVIYSESNESQVVVAAAIAGAAAVVGKESPTATLIEVIRAIARDPRTTPPVTLEMQRQAAGRLEADDLPILSMRLAGEPADEIGRVLGLSPAAMAVRLARMVDRLKPTEMAG
ncbi:MAG: response regulator [Solirubrobacterales bacterium]